MATRDADRGATGTAVPRLDEEVARMIRRTPGEIAQACMLEAVQSARPLSPGKTWLDVISGQWPGDESDEVVRAALDDLS